MVISEKLLKKHKSALSKRLSSKTLPRGVLATLLIFSIAMITMPLTAYYAVSYLAHGSTVMGATAAIIAVHVILAGFVYKAVGEPAAEIEMKED